MQGTLAEMRTSRELENRAWIGMKSMEFQNVPDGVDLVASYENSGNTPAKVTVVYEARNLSEPPADDIPYTPIAHSGSVLALFPKTQYSGLVAHFKGMPVIPDPKTPDDQFYIFGSLDYDDIFGHHHRTNFCYRTGKEEEGGKVTAGHILVCPTHNTFN